MSDLPIRRVVLYKHGVGYFEREGQVTDAAVVALSFKQREVSDVLKSLTILDLDGGTVSAVSYDSTTPVEQLLAEIALHIPDSGSLVGLLPQLKGARVAVKPVAATAPVLGVLLGIDTVDTNTDAGVSSVVRVSVMTDTAEVKTFDLFDIELQLLDDGVKRDLDFYLKTQLAAKKKDARTFSLFAQGEGERTLRASYVLEAPVWKATYRILLSENPSPLGERGRGEGESGLGSQESPSPLAPLPPGEGGTGETLIQGWAVVDNTSDEDWEDVGLTLVAGLPVSFVHDLYTPRYIRRPVVEVRESTGVLPPMAEAGVMMAMDDAEAESSVDVMGGSGVRTREMAKMRAMPAVTMAARGGRSGFVRDSAVSSVQTQTRERQVGDLFEYVIDNPVTVRRNQSALVPILLKPFAGRSVLLYQKQARAENPMRCVEFENTTGLTLEGGPVTVLDAGSYVGEAMLDTLKPTEKRLVGYAVELGVRVTDSIGTKKQAVARVKISGGTMWTYFGQESKTKYTFVSKSDKEQVLYLDHPRPGTDWDLIEPATPHEITENFWRFKLPLPPNATTAYTVVIRQPQSQTYGLNDLKEQTLAVWVKQQWIDAKTEKTLRAAFAIREEIGKLDATISRLDAERAKVDKDQARIRENLAPLGDRASEKELRERYVRTLGQQEDRLEQMDKERTAAVASRDAARQKLADALNGIEFETAVK